MSLHRIQLKWKNEEGDFVYESFDRTHTLHFEGGKELHASSAKEYFGNSDLANPEEMLAAALSSCHMLTFLVVASKSRLHVLSYEDHAVAHLEKNEAGVICVTLVELHPVVRFTEAIEDEKLQKLHEKAHRNCFIANSVKCKVEVHPAK